jgi:hypothetical protein
MNTISVFKTTNIMMFINIVLYNKQEFFEVSFAHLWLNTSKSVRRPSKYQNYRVFIQKDHY